MAKVFHFGVPIKCCQRVTSAYLSRWQIFVSLTSVTCPSWTGMCWWRKSRKICDIKATLTCCELFWCALVSSRFSSNILAKQMSWVVMDCQEESTLSVWCWCSDMKICSISRRLRMRLRWKKIRSGSAAPLEGGRSLWETAKKEANFEFMEFSLYQTDQSFYSLCICAQLYTYLHDVMKWGWIFVLLHCHSYEFSLVSWI